jgi:ubiquinone/menaquinone biosynthesis C-methylase UbiE
MKKDYESYVKNFLEKSKVKDDQDINAKEQALGSMIYILDKRKLEKKSSLKNLTLLEMGAGTGQFLEHLIKNKVFKDVKGIDITGSLVKFAEKRNRPVEHNDYCIMEGVEDNSYDFVYAYKCMGAAFDTFDMIREMARIARRYVIIVTKIPGDKEKDFSFNESLNTWQVWFDKTPTINVTYSGKNPALKNNRNEFIFMLSKKAV